MSQKRLLVGASVWRIAINPITWTRDETSAPAAKNLGPIMPADGVFVPVAHYADARVNKAKGAVICSTADADKLFRPGSFVKGVFHSSFNITTREQ